MKQKFAHSGVCLMTNPGQLIMTRGVVRSIGSGSQRGYATILLILFVATGIVALTLGTLFAVQGAQRGQLAVHAATQAQARTWTAVEAIRQYLLTLSATTAASLTSSIPVTGLAGSVTATVVSNTATSSGRRITVDISASGGGSTTTVQAVYDLSPGSGTTSDPGTSNVDVGVNVKGDVSLSGGISFGGGANAKVYVDGNVTIGSVSLTGLNTLCSTGNISIGSSVVIPNICANGTLTMTGGAGATTATVIGNVTMNSGGTIATLVSNGDVTITNGSITNLSTKGNVTVNCGGCSISNISTEGNVSWNSSANATSIAARNVLSYQGTSSGTANISTFGSGASDTGVVLSTGAGTNNVSSNKNVSVGSWDTYIRGTLAAKGNLTVSNNGSHIAAGKYGGTLTGSSTANLATRQAGFDPAVGTVSVAAIAPLTVTVNHVDAYALKDSANFVFERSSEGKIKVTVKNVSGLTAGTYYVGSYMVGWNQYNNYLCPSVTESGRCPGYATPGPATAPYSRICTGGNYEAGACITVDSSNNWTVTGTTLAPGVAWFDGSVTLTSGGKYYSTIIATKNITTGGSQVLFAPNWVGYNTECLGNFSSAPATGTGNNVTITAANGPLALAPSQYCSTGSYVADTVGNMVAIAGSYIPNTTTYQGGDINLGASTSTYGSVMAGNKVITGGSVSIRGTIIASGDQGSGNNSGSLSGSTSVDMSSAPSTFDPTKVPCTVGCSGGGGGGGSGSSGSSSVLWTRYR